MSAISDCCTHLYRCVAGQVSLKSNAIHRYLEQSQVLMKDPLKALQVQCALLNISQDLAAVLSTIRAHGRPRRKQTSIPVAVCQQFNAPRWSTSVCLLSWLRVQSHLKIDILKDSIPRSKKKAQFSIKLRENYAECGIKTESCPDDQEHGLEHCK